MVINICVKKKKRKKILILFYCCNIQILSMQWHQRCIYLQLSKQSSEIFVGIKNGGTGPTLKKCLRPLKGASQNKKRVQKVLQKKKCAKLLWARSGAVGKPRQHKQQQTRIPVWGITHFPWLFNQPFVSTSWVSPVPNQRAWWRSGCWIDRFKHFFLLLKIAPYVGMKKERLYIQTQSFNGDRGCGEQEKVLKIACKCQ